MKNVEFNLPIKQWQLGFTSICVLERLLWCLCRGLELSREGEQVLEGKHVNRWNGQKLVTIWICEKGNGSLRVYSSIRQNP